MIKKYTVASISLNPKYREKKNFFVKMTDGLKCHFFRINLKTRRNEKENTLKTCD